MKYHVISLFLASIGVLSSTQALIFGGVASPRAAYFLAWLSSSVVLAWAFEVWIDVGRSTSADIRADTHLAIVIVALVIAAAALWSGAHWGRARVAPGETFVGRLLAIVPIQVAAVLIGSCAAIVVLSLVALFNIH